jgi:hypothetical protein
MHKINSGVTLQNDYRKVLKYFLRRHGEKELYILMIKITNQVQAMLSRLPYRPNGQKLRSKLLVNATTLKKQRKVTYQITVETHE